MHKNMFFLPFSINDHLSQWWVCGVECGGLPKAGCDNATGDDIQWFVHVYCIKISVFFFCVSKYTLVNTGFIRLTVCS
jgi:hypothetical protein